MAIGSFQHTPSGAVVFGPGARAAVGDKTFLKKHAAVLVVTDAAVLAAGVADDVIKALGDRVVIVDSAVVAAGDTEHVAALAARAKDAGVTTICAVGGGSVIDTAKGVAAVLATGKDLKALEGVAGVGTKTIPVVAIPSTSGRYSRSPNNAAARITEKNGLKRLTAEARATPKRRMLS